jgi:hypothetical protein
MIVQDDVGTMHEGDNVLNSNEMKKQINEERKKNTLFTRITKYFSYAVGFIIVLLVARRLLRRISVEPINEEKTK